MQPSIFIEVGSLLNLFLADDKAPMTHHNFFSESRNHDTPIPSLTLYQLSHCAPLIQTREIDLILPRTKFRPYLKPYWYSTLKDLPTVVREKRCQWNRAGRTRGNRHFRIKIINLLNACFEHITEDVLIIS